MKKKRKKEKKRKKKRDQQIGQVHVHFHMDIFVIYLLNSSHSISSPFWKENILVGPGRAGSTILGALSENFK